MQRQTIPTVGVQARTPLSDIIFALVSSPVLNAAINAQRDEGLITDLSGAAASRFFGKPELATWSGATAAWNFVDDSVFVAPTPAARAI